MNAILVITGAAPGVIFDLMCAQDLLSDRPADYMAIGQDAVDRYLYPSLKYVATYHPEDIPEIYRRRNAARGNIDFQVIGHKHNPMIHHVITDRWKPSGSSALLGVQAAIQAFGYLKIILCGCPLEGESARGAHYRSFRAGWEERSAEVLGPVKSMSGWTREFLGEPTEEWLK